MRQGIRKVAVLNNLGGLTETSVQPRGNFIVKTAVRQLNYAHPELDAVWVQPLTAGKAELAEIFESGADDIHAGEVETSLMLALRPDLVQGGAADVVPTVPRNFLDWAPFERLAPGGVWGRPSLASAEKGERALDAAARGTVRYITESFDALAKAKGRLPARRGGAMSAARTGPSFAARLRGGLVPARARPMWCRWPDRLGGTGAVHRPDGAGAGAWCRRLGAH